MTKNNEVRFLDLSVNNPQDRNDFHEALNRCMDHGQFVMGQEISTLEKQLSVYVGRSFCISVSSGTDAVYLALKGIDIQPGDDVITTPLSWIATANAIRMTGANPVFCDINDDLNLDPSSIEKLITNNTKAILSVDYTGNMADYDALGKIVKKYNLKLIEDGSQAFGAEYLGKKCGSFGEVSAISHNPMKIFGGLGEIGSVYTNNQAIAEKIEILRYNGTVNKEFLKYPSLNFRADSLNSAFLQTRLKSLPRRLKRRDEIAKRYSEKLKNVCDTPKQTENSKRVFYTYTIQIDERDQLSKYLAENKIETKIQHPLLMSEQPPYLECISNTPKAQQILKRVLCLPIHEGLSNEQVDYVIDKILNFKN